MGPLQAEKHLELLSGIDVVFFDFDGVFTDNRVLVSESGAESVFCYRSDGVGISRIKELGIGCAVISAETNPVVARRCEKLNIDCVQGVDEKEQVLQRMLADRELSPEDAAFVGNDVGDIECMLDVGVPIAVADAYPEVKAVAKLTTSRMGGQGAVREVCDWIVEARRVGGSAP